MTLKDKILAPYKQMTAAKLLGSLLVYCATHITLYVIANKKG